jgi:hypothetical protein
MKMFKKIINKYSAHKLKSKEFHDNWDHLIKTDSDGKNKFIFLCREKIHQYLDNNNISYSENEQIFPEEYWIEGEIEKYSLKYWIHDITVSVKSNIIDTYLEYYDFQTPEEMISEIVNMIDKSINNVK